MVRLLVSRGAGEAGCLSSGHPLHIVVTTSLTVFGEGKAAGAVGMWKSRSDFQAWCERCETWVRFCIVCTARHFHRCIPVLPYNAATRCCGSVARSHSPASTAPPKPSLRLEPTVYCQGCVRAKLSGMSPVCTAGLAPTAVYVTIRRGRTCPARFLHTFGALCHRPDAQLRNDWGHHASLPFLK